MIPPPYKKLRILGIDFINEGAIEVVQQLKSGGLLVVPAAPALITIPKDDSYYQSLLDADVVIPDSGYMVLIWNLLHRQKITRISGLEFLIAFFNDKDVRSNADFLLVDPSSEDSKANMIYLEGIGIAVKNNVSYLAPMYDKALVLDAKLLSVAEARRPKYIIINLGGGTQEKLGAYLKRNLSYEPGIICTGAAIAFLSGRQARIPQWADRIFLGWLFRCIENPGLYVPRYFRAIKLVAMMLRFGKNAPR